MNVDRLLRDVEQRLPGLKEDLRQEVTEALREAIAREERHLGPTQTVETERERRRTAEELRQALEAIHRPTRLEETLEEVLTQLGRVITLDYAAVAAREPGDAFRVVAARGAEEEPSGSVVTHPRLDEVRESRHPVIVADAEAAEITKPLPGAPSLKTWAALPLLLEGDVVGLLLAGRVAPPPFSEEEILRGKAVAFWAAAALRRGQLLEQVRRYAALLEQIVAVDQSVFDGAGPDAVAQDILQAACRVGGYGGGLLVLQTPKGPVVGATSGESFAGAGSRPAPPDLAATTSRRLPPERMLEVAEALGTELPAEQTYLVPLATPEAYVGCLVLPDPNGESPDDRLMEAFASRAAAAWRHAALHHGRP
ncbi:MAG: GAF domain-containing protein [Vicinamibacteria bacterium]